MALAERSALCAFFLVVLTSPVVTGSCVLSWGEAQKLTDTNAQLYGTAVAVSNDTAAVGDSHYGFSPNAQRGAVYLYLRNTPTFGSWGSATRFEPSDASSGANYGAAVTLTATVLAVGAPGLAVGFGGIYVYSRPSTASWTWTLTQKLSPAEIASLGTSVALYGDTLVAGAPAISSYAGSMFVYYRNEGGTDNWGLKQIRYASDPAQNVELGTSVAIFGDVAVAGAPKKTCTAGANCGAAYVYGRHVGGTDNWGFVAKLTAPDAGVNAFYGAAVTLSQNTIAISAYGRSNSAGGVYIYQLVAGAWTLKQTVAETTLQPFDYFGFSVALYNTSMVVGAEWTVVDGFSKSGVAYLYSQNSTGFYLVKKLLASGQSTNWYFGGSAAIFTDVVLVGAPGPSTAVGGRAVVFGCPAGKTGDLCATVDCCSLDVPAGGVTSCTGTTQSSTCSITCNSGYTLTSASSSTCLASGLWSVAPNCSVVDCGIPQSLSTGGAMSCPGGLTFGQTCSFSCATGYTQSGSTSRTCLSTGAWDGTTSTCTPVSCAPAPQGGVLTNGAISCTGTTFSFTCSVSCNTGFALTGSSTRTCQASGLWSGVDGTCNVVNCGQPQTTPGNGTLTCPVTTFGSTCTASCNAGYVLSGSVSRSCQASGLWTGTSVSCQVVTCGIPQTSPSNGAMTCGGFVSGSVCTFACNTGYIANGTARICQSSTLWNSTNVGCIPVDCGVVQSTPSHGTLSCTGTSFADVCSFTCNTGYTLVGSTTRTCTGAAIWSGVTTSCSPVSCGVPQSSLPDGSISCSGTTFGETCTVRCNEGWTQNGPQSRTCQANGTWTGSTSTCTIVDCGSGQAAPANNGNVTCNGTTYLSTCNFSCPITYAPTPVSKRTCLASGLWSDSLVSCQLLCPTFPATPTHGAVVCAPVLVNPFTCSVLCPAGYQLSNVESRTCLTTGQWSTTDVNCTLNTAYCPLLTAPIHGSVFCQGFVGGTCTYSCQAGYGLAGPSTRTCLPGFVTVDGFNGTWSDSAPECVVPEGFITPTPILTRDAIIGIAVGAAVFLALLILLIILCCCFCACCCPCCECCKKHQRDRKDNRAPPERQQPVPEDSQRMLPPSTVVKSTTTVTEMHAMDSPPDFEPPPPPDRNERRGNRGGFGEIDEEWGDTEALRNDGRFNFIPLTAEASSQPRSRAPSQSRSRAPSLSRRRSPDYDQRSDNPSKPALPLAPPKPPPPIGEEEEDYLAGGTLSPNGDYEYGLLPPKPSAPGTLDLMPPKPPPPPPPGVVPFRTHDASYYAPLEPVSASSLPLLVSSDRGRVYSEGGPGVPPKPPAPAPNYY